MAYNNSDARKSSHTLYSRLGPFLTLRDMEPSAWEKKNPVQWRSFVLLHTPFKAPFTCQFSLWFSALGLLTHTAQWCTWGNREERGLIRSGAWCWPQARDSEHVKWERKPPARGWKQRCKSRKQENIQTQNKILFLRFVILHCPQTMSTVNQQKSETSFSFYHWAFCLH